MELITLLLKQNKILESILDCLKREKQALIKEDAPALLEIIEEKKQYINALEQMEKKREDTYPGMSLTKLKQSGLLTDELEAAGKEMHRLTKLVSEYQETNELLTRQSLAYVNKMISVIKGGQKSTYDAKGKMDGQDGDKSILNRSV